MRKVRVNGKLRQVFCVSNLVGIFIDYFAANLENVVANLQISFKFPTTFLTSCSACTVHYDWLTKIIHQ